MTNSKRKRKGKYSERLGRTVSYPLNGKIVVRTIGVRTAPFSQEELINQMTMAVVQRFLNAIEGFLHVGYEQEARLSNQNQQNVSFSYHRKNALAGIYPDIGINYRKVLVSKGALGPPKDPVVRINRKHLLFTWKYDPNDETGQWGDQVMLLAYFPEVNKAVYETAGVKREKGTAVLELPKTLKVTIVETYIAFISPDRRQVSNSIYTGQLSLTR